MTTTTKMPAWKITVQPAGAGFVLTAVSGPRVITQEKFATLDAANSFDADAAWADAIATSTKLRRK